MITQLLNKLIRKTTNSRPPDLLIDIDYMERWYLIPRNRLFNVYAHRFIGSDAPTPHDHPWFSLGLILEGEYIEHTPTGSSRKYTGDLSFRRPRYLHWIEIDKPVYTLFITGPNLYNWGFLCDSGWIDHEQYITQRGPNRRASGCGEYNAATSASLAAEDVS